MPREVRPYLLPTAGAVVLDPWELVAEGVWQPLPDQLPDWDGTVTHSVRRIVHLDLARLLDETRLGHDVVLGWTISWIGSTSKMRGTAPVVPVGAGGPTLLDAELPGDRIDGTLTLRTTLALVRGGATRRAGVAHLPGSVLVDDTVDVVLGDPTSSGFPVQAVDFATTRLDTDASWHLETTTDLTAPFLGSFLLLLNTRDGELIDAVAKERRDRRQEALVDELEHGVAVVLLELAAHARAELVQIRSWPPGSVGETLSRMLQRAERSGALQVPIGPQNVARARTRSSGAARAIGYGRRFR